MGGHFTNYELKGKARLPKLFEIEEVCENSAAKICPDWMVNYLSADSKYPNKIVINVVGYWTLSSNSAKEAYAWPVYYNGIFKSYTGDWNNNNVGKVRNGIRPVITLKKSSLVN